MRFLVSSAPRLLALVTLGALLSSSGCSCASASPTGDAALPLDASADGDATNDAARSPDARSVAQDGDVAFDAGPFCELSRAPICEQVSQVPHDRATRLLVETDGCSTFEGTWNRLEPVTGPGFRLVIALASGASCRFVVTGVDRMPDLAVSAGAAVVGGIARRDVDGVPVSLWVAFDRGLACAGEQEMRYPLLVDVHVDDHAYGATTRSGVSYGIVPGCACHTVFGTGCDFCQSSSDACWYTRSGLLVRASESCGAPIETELASGAEAALAGTSLRAWLAEGLYARECEGPWLPEVGRGSWMVWRANSP